MKKNAFTLIELMIVVVIVGVIATFVIPSFSNSKEKSADTEAATMLQSIKSAEKMYRLKNDSDLYIACDDAGTPTCSVALGLDLTGEGLWRYKVTTIPATPTYLWVTATRTNTGARVWSVFANTEPSCSGC